MKEIIVLKKNGIMEVKNERKITKSDLKEIQWLLVNVTSTETESRNYTLIEPSSLLLFDKAIVSYQLCEKFQDCDYDIEIHEFSPVKFSTDSITDVISIINSADKLNIINNLMIEDFSDNSGQYGLSYMGITLIKDDNVIYDKYYRLKGIDGALFDSFQVVKKFKELYNGNMSSEFKEKGHFIIFKEECGEMRWKLSSKPPEKGMFGFPNVISNSITIMNAYEYSRINKYIGSTAYYCIYYENMDHIDSIANYIKLGKYTDAFEKLDQSSDVFINVARMLHKSYRDIGFILSVICNLEFIFMTTQTMYRIIYPSYNPGYYNNDDENAYDFDSVLSIMFRVTSKETKTIAFNKDTILTPTQIFNLL